MIALGAFFRWKVGSYSGFWSDEAEVMFVVRAASIREMVRFLSLHESHPPLFYLLVRAWLNLEPTSSVPIVALPVLFGTMLIPAVYLAGRQMFSPFVAVCAAILVASNPFLAHYSGYVRPYSLLPLLSVASLWGLWHGLGRGGWHGWTTYTIATTAMLLTHNWAWLILGAQVAAVGLWLLGRRDRKRPFGYWCGSLAGIAVTYGWWVPSLMQQIHNAGHAARKSWTLQNPLYPFVELSRVTIGIPAEISLLVMVSLVGVAFYTAKGRSSSPDTIHPHLALYLGTCIPLLSVIAAAALSGRTWLTPEYCLLIPVPLLLLSAARGLEGLARRRASLLLLIAAFGLASLYLLTWSQLASVGKSNAREFTLDLSPKVRPTDLFVVVPGFVALSFNYYFAGANAQIAFPFLELKGALPYDRMAERTADPETSRLALTMIKSARRQQHRVWFLTRCDWYSFPRHIPSLWIAQGALTSDVPLLVDRFHLLRDTLQLLYGTPTMHSSSTVGPFREVLCAELYAPGPR